VARGGDPQQDRSVATRQRLLDAAVDELIEKGYGRFTTLSVTERTRISRGAQQHHFPQKNALVAAAIRHLADRQIEELRVAAASGRPGAARMQRVLDLIFDLYSGPLFAAMIDLSLAARSDEELRRVIGPVEREISDAIAVWAHGLMVDGGSGGEEFERRVAMSLSSARGIALLKLLGHPHAAVARQWRHTRTELVRLLTERG
jgi:AcrR family transcriptional regulator